VRLGRGSTAQAQAQWPKSSTHQWRGAVSTSVGRNPIFAPRGRKYRCCSRYKRVHVHPIDTGCCGSSTAEPHSGDSTKPAGSAAGESASKPLETASAAVYGVDGVYEGWWITAEFFDFFFSFALLVFGARVSWPEKRGIQEASNRDSTPLYSYPLLDSRGRGITRLHGKCLMWMMPAGEKVASAVPWRLRLTLNSRSSLSSHAMQNAGLSLAMIGRSGSAEHLNHCPQTFTPFGEAHPFAGGHVTRCLS
jgi:hypothetical protein